MNLLGRISADPLIGQGRACMKWPHIMVAVILDNLSEGTSPEEIQKSPPAFCAEDS